MDCRLVLCGDVRGQLSRLADTLARINKDGAFDACVCTGAFFQTGEPASALCDAEASLSEEERDFVSGKRRFTIPVFFVDSSSSPLGGWLRENCPAGANLAVNLRYLGAYGVFKFPSGVRLAFLSGLEHPSGPPCASDSNHLFDGAFFTSRLVDLFSQVADDEAGAVDIFVSCAWPARLDRHLSPECVAALEGACSAGQPLAPDSDYVASWSRSMESRYHVSSGRGCFYQRPAFPGSRFGYTRRFVGLAPVREADNAGQSLKWMHALVISHLGSKPLDLLTALPAHSTDDPLSRAKRPAVGWDRASKSLRTDGATEREIPNEGRDRSERPDRPDRPERSERRERPERRDRPDRERGDRDRSRRDPPPSCTVHVGNLPYEFSSVSLVETMGYFGEIEDVRFPTSSDGRSKGTAWITFKSLESAARAVDANRRLISDNRLLRVQYARSTPRREMSIDTRSHTDCWFCLVNPDGEKRLIVEVAETVYVTLAKGGINSNHALVVPIEHFPCLALAPDDVVAETNLLVERLAAAGVSDGHKDCLVFERYFPMRKTTMMHTQLQVRSSPNDDAGRSVELV